jgi:hypothetical protein
MNPQMRAHSGERRQRQRSIGGILFTLVLLALVALPPLPAGALGAVAPLQAATAPGGQAAAALPPFTSVVQAVPEIQATQQTTTTLTLSVVSARTEPRFNGGAGVTKGDPVTQYRFIINEDNVGDPSQPRYPDCSPYMDASLTTPNPEYPAKCNWPSIRTMQGYSPIVTQGDETILNGTTGIALAPGKYLISVLAEGYKIDGMHFTVPLSDPGLLKVPVHPLPLPAATVRMRVFNDIMTNGQPDPPVDTGLAGFRAILNDIAGPVTQDVYGNPICAEYEKDADGNYIIGADGNPIYIEGTGGGCFSDANGDIVIPNMAPNRFDTAVIPPTGQAWIQTTTLEGNVGWDTWIMQGSTGFDHEFMLAGEPYPWTIFGFVQPRNELIDTTVTGGIKGTIVAASVYIPENGGLPYYGSVWGGLNGAKITGPIESPWLALLDLQNGDTAVWVGQGNPDGSFLIPHVPDGDYLLSYWDQPQNYILDLINVSVIDGQISDIGTPMLTGWFTNVEGTVFVDTNENGQRDPGEQGVPNILISVKRRENSSMDRGNITTFTDDSGNYVLENLYPLTSWLIIEAYDDRYQTVGVTWQADNQPEPTTVPGNGVDVGILPIIGLSGRLDWAVKPYDLGTNGGIAGTVTYDSLRNETDARYAVFDAWQPGIPGLRMELYSTVKDANGDFVLNPDGSYAKGPLLNTYTTEQFVRPKNCQLRDMDGNPVDQFVMPPATGGYDCLEAPMSGVQFQKGFTEIDGNFAFSEILTNTDGTTLTAPIPIPAGDYLVEVVIPNDSFGQPLYQVTREEDINVYTGDTYYPAIPPPPCAGALHTVDVMGVPPDGPDAVFNPGWAEAGGSLYEGQQMPLCNVKLVTVTDQRSVAPTFALFTEVPIPGRWNGYIVDDLNLSTDRQDLFFGEKAGIEHMPIGIYDFTHRLVYTTQSDPNGVYEVLMPSSSTYDDPSPTGFAPDVYYQLGNDPGQPGRPNPNYNPQYRSIGTNFEVFPGDIIPADLAPTTIGVSILAPGSTSGTPAQCALDVTTPELFAVSSPYFQTSTGGSLTITGQHFGATQGAGTVTLQSTGGVTFTLAAGSWSDHQIVAAVPASMRAGPYQLMVTHDNGEPLVNGLTIHLLGPSYNPTLFEVGPGKPYATVQSAIDAASVPGLRGLVVVYPGAPEQWNPLGVYFENPVLYRPVKLQGIGPGGVYPDGSQVAGSVLDGRFMEGDTAYATQWRTMVSGLTWDGNQIVPEGQVVFVLAQQGDFTRNYRAAVDGFAIQGGNQQGFPTNPALVGEAAIPEPQAFVEIQGGAIFVNGYGRYLQVTNNVIRSNGGAYGAIRLGTPNTGSNHNENLLIANNQILANGGTNLAGALGIFNGADNYEVAYNHFCGNFSAEYGGAISHYGYSPNGKIHNNRIYFNRSYDEGGGIMIAGEMVLNPQALSPGAGPVDVYNNIIQSNLANDDGGGLRFLMAGDFAFNVYNNIIANNISTHEGGGISLNDAPDVRVYNNTIVKNLTTATALTSNGLPAPAGLSTSANSVMLQATLPADAPAFSDPLLFNNIFWDNRAGSWTGGGVAGIGLPGDPTPINYWDLGLADQTDLLSPTYSMLQVADGTVPDASNQVGVDPMTVAAYTTTVSVLPWRGGPQFVGNDIVAVDLPPTLMGDYHLQAASAAIDAGTASKAGAPAPTSDIDGDPRPVGAGLDIGADETVAAVAIQAGPPGSLGFVPVVLPGTAFGAVRIIQASTGIYLPIVFRSGALP